MRSPSTVGRALERAGATGILLDGESWRPGPLVALRPRVDLVAGPRGDRGSSGGPSDPLRALDEIVAARRAAGGPAETGVAALLGYDLLDSGDRPDDRLPRMVVLAVDRSLRFQEGGRALLTLRQPEDEALGRPEVEVDRLRSALDRLDVDSVDRPAARIEGRPRTSLPREAYLCGVRQVKRHIERGDVYQANLSQRFQVGYAGDPFELYLDLVRSTPAPRSAWIRTPRLALASVSPETFLRADPEGRVETRPIKGTRPRGSTPASDRAARRSLLKSEKDRAELLMIVDLERNDLSRVCDAGSVRVERLAELRSYSAVHHLMARVRGRLRREVGVAELIRATFPGGSITGAPKIRAMEILARLEPVGRNLFTGSLVWFGDDGTIDSSILIRTLVFDGERAFLGAGGGIVADSDPEEEWRESNHKARALAAALGFEPEEAS